MGAWLWLASATGALAAVATGFWLWLRLSGRREHARALAGFVPDFLVLSTRLVRDPRVPLRFKLLLVLLAGYLASPLDLLPGSPLDDALVAAFVLRLVLRGNAGLAAEHWPGPQPSLALVLRLTGARGSTLG
jgi:uncharacterized membrane protein YkvA (DUF1232 family)